MDPYVRADITSDQYYDWLVKNAYLAAYGVMKTAAFLETFVEYPPSQPPASFSVDQIVESVKKRIEQQQQQRKRLRWAAQSWPGERTTKRP
jgi:arylsulfatase